MLLLPALTRAQQYTGISGLLHVPSAEMNPEGDARIGGHFLNKAMTPDTGFIWVHDKYNTYDYYMAITPYRWLELSYVCTERKVRNEGKLSDYGSKDRYVSIKVRPLEEGRYWPAVAIGCNDVGTSAISSLTHTNVQLYFQNYYIAATKHLDLSGHQLGFTLAYRHFHRGYNAKWNGLVGGITYRPAFCPDLRAIVEYTGNEFLLGFDAHLWRHLMIQASLKDFQHLNVGICFDFNLLGKSH